MDVMGGEGREEGREGRRGWGWGRIIEFMITQVLCFLKIPGAG
jgi:hypothetical protein